MKQRSSNEGTAITRRSIPRLASALLLLLGLGLASCSSTPSDGRTGDRLRITLRDYQGGRNFELVSESHSDRIAYYSSVRDDANRKYQVDAVVAALLRELDKSGFDKYAQDGRAPSSAGGALTRAFEIQDNDRVRHWVIGDGSNSDEKRRFIESMTTFVQLYNVTESFQAIQNENGERVFEERSDQGT